MSGSTMFDVLDVSTMSMMERIALLPNAEREEIITKLTESDITSSEFVLRPAQLEALQTDAWIVAAITGRGFGKTMTLAHWVNDKARVPGTRIHLVGRTVADVRDVMVQGDSGIIKSAPADFKPEYTPSLRRLVWPNGSIALTFSADAPSQLRGPQSDYTACDEIAAWKHMPDDSGATAWDHVKIGTRLGLHPQIFVATTPKRIQAIRDLVDQAKRDPELIKIITGSIFDNRSNLSREYLQTMSDMYAGTALERQELFGELILLVEEALWQEKDIKILPFDDDTVFKATGYHKDQMIRIVAVDPSVTTGGDATGIVVVYVTPERKLQDRTAWVVDDLTDSSGKGVAVETWASVVADARKRHSVPGNECIVVVEGNQGGELLESVLKQQDPTMPIARLHAPAGKGKANRAEPVVFAYRRGRVFHAEDFPELVEEYTSWEPKTQDSKGSRWSPNRLDAAVWGLTVGLLDDKAIAHFKPIRVQNEASKNTSLSSRGSAWRNLGGLGSHRPER